MTVDPPRRDQEIVFDFVMPRETRTGWGIAILTILLIADLLAFGSIARQLATHGLL